CVGSVRSYLVQWSEIALADADRLIDYIAQRNPQRAVEIWDKIKNRVATLERFPFRSRLVPELKALNLEDYRELIIYSYRILFRVKGNKVLILGLFDGRRDLEDVMIERVLAE